MITQFWGVTTALLALIGHQIFDGAQNYEVKLLLSLPFLFSYGVLGAASIWHWVGRPKTWRPSWFFSDNRTELNFVTFGAYTNSFSLAFMVFLSGGVHGLFTPLFLLVPHTTATFLRKTKYKFNIYIVFGLTMLLYFLVSWLGTQVNTIRVLEYVLLSFFILLSAIALEIFLAIRRA